MTVLYWDLVASGSYHGPDTSLIVVEGKPQRIKRGKCKVVPSVAMLPAVSPIESTKKLIM